MLPDQAERAIVLAIATQRRAALVMVENALFGIIGTADIIDDAIGPGRDPFRRPAPLDFRLRKQPCQHNTREQLIGMEATGMGDEEVRYHVRMRLVVCGRSA